MNYEIIVSIFSAMLNLRNQFVSLMKFFCYLLIYLHTGLTTL